MRVVLNGICESNRKNAIKKGEISGKFGPYGFYSESFLLFRGVSMKKDWLAVWLKKIGRVVNVNGIMSTSKSTKVALELAHQCRENKKINQAVLFVILV